MRAENQSDVDVHGDVDFGVDPGPYLVLLKAALRKFFVNAQEVNFPPDFIFRDAPVLTLLDFIERISKYQSCITPDPTLSPFIVAIRLLVQFFEYSSSQFRLNEAQFGQIHKLFFTAFLIATKITYDILYRADSYALLSGMSQSELSALERIFLSSMGHNVNCPAETFSGYLSMYKHAKSNPHFFSQVLVENTADQQLQTPQPR